jgi:hypothetical protein
VLDWQSHAQGRPLCYRKAESGRRGGRHEEKHEQADLTLKVIVDPASRTVLRVNQEPQSPILFLSEFLTAKQHKGWEVTGIAPSGTLLLLILKRPLFLPLQPEDGEG